MVASTNHSVSRQEHRGAPSKDVIEEEERILRLADHSQAKQAFFTSEEHRDASNDSNHEQQKAYEKAGYRVRAFGPDSATTSNQ